MTKLGADLFQRIESQRISRIRRIKINNVIEPFFGNEINHFIGQFAVRINHRQTPAGFNIRNGHIFQKR